MSDRSEDSDRYDRHIRPMLRWLERAAWHSPTGWIPAAQVAETLQAHGKTVPEGYVRCVLQRAVDLGLALYGEDQFRTQPPRIRIEDLAISVLWVSQTARRLQAAGGWVTATDIFEAAEVERPLYELVARLDEAVEWGLEARDDTGRRCYRVLRRRPTTWGRRGQTRSVRRSPNPTSPRRNPGGDQVVGSTLPTGGAEPEVTDGGTPLPERARVLVQALMPGEQLTETEIEARLGWANTTVRRAHRFARKHGMLRRLKDGRAYRYYVPTSESGTRRRRAGGRQLHDVGRQLEDLATDVDGGGR